MAWRYRVLFPQAGETLYPEDWNRNHAEFAEELNGYLDRDNFRFRALGIDQVVNFSFVKCHMDQHTTATAVTTAENTVEWQDGDSSNDIAKLDIDVPTDALLECEFGGTWDNPDLLANNNEIRFRLIVDGVTIGMSGFESPIWASRSVQLDGAVPVLAGKHTIQAQVQTAGGNPLTQGYTAQTGQYTIEERSLVVIETRR